MLWNMADDTELARAALTELEDAKSRGTALGVLYGASPDVRQRLLQLVLPLRNDPALAEAVSTFLSEHQAGV